MKKLFIVITSLTVAVVIIALAIKSEATKPKLRQKHVETVQQKYEALLKRLSTDTVCPNISPVHIFMQEEGDQPRLCATGGQFILDKTILTCAHAFWKFTGQEKKPCRYYYQILQPYEIKLHPIESIRQLTDAPTEGVNWSKDMVTCTPGKSQLIAPIPPPRQEDRLNGAQSFTNYSVLKEKLPVRSTVTGETRNIIGGLKVSSGTEYFVLDYESFPSQSGTLFTSEDHKVLYVLSASMNTNPQMINKFHLDPSCKGLTLCSAVSVN